jgi:hypothetical protein
MADFKVSLNDSTLYTFIDDLYDYPGVISYFNTAGYNFLESFADF